MFDTFLFVGPQGSGKTTQARLLADFLKAEICVLGYEFRKLAAAGGELGVAIEKILNAGEIQPLTHLRAALGNFAERNRGKPLVFDSLIRNAGQAPILDDLLENGERQPAFLFLELEEEEARRRILSRVEQEEEVRDDETKSVIERRLALFNKETKPATKQLAREKNIPLLRVDARPGIEEVFFAIRAALEI